MQNCAFGIGSGASSVNAFVLFGSRFERNDNCFLFNFRYLLDGRALIEFPDMINFYRATPFRLVLVYVLMDHPFFRLALVLRVSIRITCKYVYGSFRSINFG